VTSPGDLHVVTVPQTDPRLGRQVVHDPRSRNFTFRSAETPRRDITLRVYNPQPNPSQPVGCCTGVDAVVKCNTAGNRIKGNVLGMANALKVYSRATQLDPWPGSYPPEDTGSSATAACQASLEQGLIERYEWIFTGTDGIYAALTEGRPVGVGTWWLENMFEIDHMSGLIDCSGPRVGGHQFTIVGYRKKLDAFIGMCWWGPNWGMDRQGRFLIRRASLQDLLMDDGDCHVVRRRVP
jgi:hypothetical protein